MTVEITIWLFIRIAINVLAMERIMGVFYEKRKTSFRFFTLSLLCAFALASLAILTMPTGILPLPIHQLFLYTVPVFIITLNYKSLFIKRLVVTTSFYLVTISMIVLWDLFYATLYHVASINILAASGWLREVGLFAAVIADYLVFSLLRRFKNIKKDTINLPKVWVPALVLPILFISQVFSIAFETPEYIQAFFISIVLSSVGFLTIFIYDTLSAGYADKLESALHTQEKEYYFSQCELMQESAEQVKAIRHDMKIHLAALKGFIVDNKDATDYLTRLLGNIGDSEVYSDTGNIAFDSIINFKLSKAKEDNIKLDIHLLIPSALNIEVADVVTILGNLLDNALDAVKKADDKMIRLNVSFDKGGLFINVENTFDGTIAYIEGSLEEERELTTLKDGDRYGYGLKNIRKTAEKYDGHVDISHKGNVFSVGILLYVGDE